MISIGCLAGLPFGSFKSSWWIIFTNSLFSSGPSLCVTEHSKASCPSYTVYKRFVIDTGNFESLSIIIVLAITSLFVRWSVTTAKVPM